MSYKNYILLFGSSILPRRWGKMRLNRWNVTEPISISIFLSVLLIVIKLVHGCPLRLDSSSHQESVIYNIAENSKVNMEDLSIESRNLETTASSILSKLMVHVVKFLLISVFGKKSWFSEDIALRRLDDLKSTLFNYYGNSLTSTLNSRYQSV